MTKRAVSLGLAMLMAASTAILAQSAATQAAVDESVYRTANLMMLRQKLTEAKAALARQELPVAATLYDNAVELAQKVGPSNAQLESAEAVSGLAQVRVTLAQQAAEKGDWREAETQLERVLKVDPKNQPALELKAKTDKVIAENKGLWPSKEALAQVKVAHTNSVESNTLVHDAAILLEAGQLDAADAKLNEALKLDEGNRAAYYYRDLVTEARYRLSSQRHEKANRDKMLDVSRAWEEPTQGAKLPVPNPYNGTNLIYTSKGRQAIMAKLNLIKFDSVQFDGLPLSEVVRNLSDEARRRDPEKKGINIIVNPNAPAPTTPAATFVDPATGLPVAAPPTEAVDVNGIAIKLTPPLQDVRLGEVLNAIVTVAEKPLKISLEDYAVVISLKGAEPTPLFMREFAVDPNTFVQGLEAVSGFAFDIQTSGGSGGGGGGGGAGGQGTGLLTIPRVSVAGQVQGGGVGGGGGGGGANGQNGVGLSGITTRTNNMEAVAAAVRQFFLTLGVNLDPLQGKSVFFNDRKGLLLVRATTDELDVIEKVIQVLNVAPPQVNIKAKFTEISQGDNKALGFDWFLGNTVVGGKSVLSGGTQPSLNGANPPTTVFPGNVAGGTTIAPATTDGLITGGLRNSYGRDNIVTPALMSFTGILTDPQFRVVVRAIDQRDGIDLLSEGEVTTLSGRQAQIQVVEMKTIVTGVDQSQGQQGAATPTTGNGTVNQAVAATFQTPQTQLLPFGPTLDVLPSVSSDGYTIQMTIIPTLTEFVGYDLQTAATFVPTAVTGTGQTLNSVLPLPIIRLRQVVTSCIVWDGQTVVLGGLIAEVASKLKDKVPFLGDLPWVGKLFTSESSQSQKKNLVIFVTPTIIDPAGNRAHLDDEMPFAAQGGK